MKQWRNQPNVCEYISKDLNALQEPQKYLRVISVTVSCRNDAKHMVSAMNSFPRLLNAMFLEVSKNFHFIWCEEEYAH